MKTSYLLILFVALVAIYSGCTKDPSQGLPDKLIDNVADSVLIERTDILLFNNGALVSSHPVLFDSTTERRIILKIESEVYVTFLYEGASWENSMGYYTYLASDTPSISNKKILFPNISGTGSGGALKAGDMVQLGIGKFPKGTIIGFFLVAQGWNEGHIMPGLYTHYTDKKYNINHVQQSVLFIEKNTGKLVLGFEDMSSPGGGGDYNDVVVSISDKVDPTVIPVSFDLSKVPKL